MGLFATVVQRISDHPVLFIVLAASSRTTSRRSAPSSGGELRVRQGLRTLDLGCGPGAFADLFAGDDYVGVDLNSRYIDHARKYPARGVHRRRRPQGSSCPTRASTRS